VDLALAEVDLLRAVPAGEREAHRAEQGRQLLRLLLADRELDESHALDASRRGHRLPAPPAPGHEDEGALAICRDLAGRSHAEAVVEKTQRAAERDGGDRGLHPLLSLRPSDQFALTRA